MIGTLALGLALAAADVPPSSTSASPLPELAVPATAPGAPADTLTRVPGSALRLGWTEARAEALGQLKRTGGTGDVSLRAGDVRWFGASAQATLTFRSGRLAEARLSVNQATPRLQSYVPDELIRQGYHRVGDEISGPTRTTEWEGATARVKLIASGSNLSAEVSPRPAEKPAPAVAAKPPPEPAAATLAPAAAPIDFTGPGPADSLPPPRRAFTPPDPVRPKIAIEASVFGRVQVRAEIGADGTVTHAEIARGIPEFNQAALGWADQVRFEPYMVGGRAVPFTILIPVSFLPTPASPRTRP